jgi:hypothetical protein
VPSSSPDTPRALPRALEIGCVALLLALHAWLAWSASLGKSTTSDEIAHLVAGHSYWANNDYRLQPENGNLPQRLVGLPAALAGRSLPPASDPDWARSHVWSLGHSYFYELGNPLGALLAQGRAINLLWSLGTGLLIYLWSRRLFGVSGACLSLVFFTFDPNFLAHGALATSDLCMTFFFLASAGAFWRQLRDPRPATIALSAVVFALACVAKFSAVLLPVIFALLLLARRMHRAPLTWRGRPTGSPRRSAWLFAGAAAAHVLAAWLVIWLCFGLRHAPAAPGMPAMAEYYRPWSVVLAGLGGTGEFLHSLSRWHLLPDAYVFGFAFVLDMSQMRGAFLNGAHSLTGWYWFFPYAFLVKSPLAFLAACAGGLGLALARWHSAGDDPWRFTAANFRARLARLGGDLLTLAPLVALVLVYGASSVLSHLNIGHRHILPLYPPLFIGLGALGAWAARHRRWLALPLFLLIAFQIVSSFSIRPHYLAYFNPLAGGPAQGYRHLVDSSLDWGQDLPGLTDFLRRDPRAAGGAPVYLSYFGTGSPAYYGIVALPLPCLPRQPGPRPWLPLKPGLYCISATMLQQVYTPLRGAWTPEREQEYQTLRALEPLFYDYATSPERRVKLQKEVSAEKWELGWERFEQLRFTRLCHSLLRREPEARIGYSIHVYSVSAAELER